LILSLQEEDFVSHICVAVTPDGKRAAAGDAISGSVKIWDLESGKSLMNIKGHQYKWEGPDVDKLRCLSLAITPDGFTLITASADQSVKVWDMRTGDALRTLGRHADWVTALVPLPDCQRLISGSRDGTLRIWNIHQDPDSIQQSFQSDGYIEAFTPDGSCAISARTDGVLSLWSLNKRISLRDMIGHKKQACQIQVSTNSRKIVSSSLDGDVMLWDLGASSPTTVLSGGFDIVPNLSITSDAKLAYSATGTYGTVQKVLWDTEKGIKLLPTIFQQDDCTAVLLSPDGKYALSANTSKINEENPRAWIEIRDVQQNQPIAMIESQGWRYVSALAIAPDGKRFYTLQPQALFEYELPGGRFLRRMLGDVEGNFEQVAFLADGHYLACTSWNHQVYVWDLDKGIVTAQFTSESSMFALLSLPGGLILAGDQSGRVHFLQLEIQHDNIKP
jgi:WD40 repeat protein